MRNNESTKIHFFKWDYWECSKIRPVIFIPTEDESYLCIPGSSESPEFDFRLSIPNEVGTVWSRTHFAWTNAELCCAHCHAPSSPAADFIEDGKLQDILDDSIPNNYTKPSKIDMRCKCELLVETDKGYWITVPKKPTPMAFVKWMEISIHDTFTLRDRYYLINRNAAKYHCNKCQKPPNSTFPSDLVGLDVMSFVTSEIADQDVLCDCTFPRFSIIEHQKSGEIGVVVKQFSKGGFNMAILHKDSKVVSKGSGQMNQPNNSNNLQKPLVYGEKRYEVSGYLYKQIGKLNTDPEKAQLGFYWSDGDFNNLPW